VNNKRFAKAIKKAVREVGFDEFVLLNDNDIYNGLYLKELVKPSMYVYYLRDKLSAMRYWKAHASRLEPKLMAICDAVVTNSEYLAAYAAEYNPNSHYVGQGCDVTQFLKAPRQEDIDRTFSGMQRPVVGYVGALNSERLDIALLTTLAESMKDVSFVLVGPEDETFRNSALHGLSNVHFPGKKDFSELPVYMYGFDVCMNPQGLNEITIGNYPRKVDEYLATGKPVVATETHAMNPFREYVYLGKTADDYAAMIRRAIAENTEARAAARRAFACEHTWANNAREIVNVIDTTKVNSSVAL
jgi:glycosyltransferase involved in cell wall biosynthesis